MSCNGRVIPRGIVRTWLLSEQVIYAAGMCLFTIIVKVYLFIRDKHLFLYVAAISELLRS